MKKSSIIIATLSLLFLCGCSPLLWDACDRQYDASPIYIDRNKGELEQIASNLFRIQTSLRFKLGDFTPTITAIGQGIAINPHYILTARHVVKIEMYQSPTPIGIMEFPISEEAKLAEEIVIVLDDGSRIKVTVVYSDKESDFALLRTEEEVHYFPFRIGNSDDFKTGDFVFLLGNFQTGLNIRSGYITQLNFIQYGSAGEIAHVDESLFGVSAVTVEGDSGSPIFLVRDGTFELGGIVNFLVFQARGLGFGTKINPIMGQIGNYLDKPNLLP